MKIDAITLIRNEVDIVSACIAQSNALFDNHTFVDMQSTDGTREYLEQAKPSGSFSILNFRTNAKYQSEISETLVRAHVNSGADWVFLLDSDEFLKIDTRARLEAALLGFSHDVMYLPWLNVIPSSFGSYDEFSMDQEFRWSGRASPFRKVALSSSFVAKNKNFSLSMGNHDVLLSNDGVRSSQVLGIPILHIPVRSKDRLVYKAYREEVVLRNKCNGSQGDGVHLKKIKELTERVDFSAENLRALAKNYGIDSGLTTLSDQEFSLLPVMELPLHTKNSSLDKSYSKRLGVSEVHMHDALVEWRKHNMVAGSKVNAVVEGDEIIATYQAIRGDSTLVTNRFKALEKNAFCNTEDPDYYKVVAEVMSAAFNAPRVYEFSAWSNLIPVLSALLSVAKPRRYVELGVHNGMSFFAACNTAQRISLDLECVAIDSWVGDEHAGFHTADVFDKFQKNLALHFPHQCYIRGFFNEAAERFEDGSIDLLHIDGFHSFEAVRNDFETWLPKMSDSGIVILHDINVHTNDFGVWRYWKELASRYPSFAFNHSHGLGIVYVGSAETPAREILRWLSEESDLALIVQTTFIGLGELMMEGERNKFELSQTKYKFDQAVTKMNMMQQTQDKAKIDHKGIEDRQRATEDRQRATEERQRATEERQRATEERQRATEEQQRAKKEQQRTAEEQQRAKKEQQRTAEEQQRAINAEAALEALISDKWWRRTRPARKLSNRIRKLRGRPLKYWPDIRLK